MPDGFFKKLFKLPDNLPQEELEDFYGKEDAGKYQKIQDNFKINYDLNQKDDFVFTPSLKEDELREIQEIQKKLMNNRGYQKDEGDLPKDNSMPDRNRYFRNIPEILGESEDGIENLGNGARRDLPKKKWWQF